MEIIFFQFASVDTARLVLHVSHALVSFLDLVEKC